MNRKLLSRLDFLTSDVGRRVKRKQIEQKQRHVYHAKERLFNPGDMEYARNYGRGEEWVPGRIDQRTAPVSFIVELEEHRMTRRHQDQKRQNSEGSDNGDSSRSRLEEKSGVLTVDEIDVQQINEMESNATELRPRRKHLQWSELYNTFVHMYTAERLSFILIIIR